MHETAEQSAPCLKQIARGSQVLAQQVEMTNQNLKDLEVTATKVSLNTDGMSEQRGWLIDGWGCRRIQVRGIPIWRNIAAESRAPHRLTMPLSPISNHSIATTS